MPSSGPGLSCSGQRVYRARQSSIKLRERATPAGRLLNQPDRERSGGLVAQQSLREEIGRGAGSGPHDSQSRVLRMLLKRVIPPRYATRLVSGRLEARKPPLSVVDQPAYYGERAEASGVVCYASTQPSATATRRSHVLSSHPGEKQFCAGGQTVLSLQNYPNIPFAPVLSPFVPTSRPLSLSLSTRYKMTRVAFKTVYLFLALAALPTVFAGLSQVLAGLACIQRNHGKHDCAEKCKSYWGHIMKIPKGSGPDPDIVLSAKCGSNEYVLSTAGVYYRNWPKPYTEPPPPLIPLLTRGALAPAQSETKL